MSCVSGSAPALPVKTREVHNHHMNSEVWNDFSFRPDDIIITSWAKSGTTWLQQIVAQLTHNADPNVPTALLSPWADLRLMPKEAVHGMLEAQTHRRFMKSHLPLDALRWSPTVKYLFIARDGRDAMWSAHHHFSIATPAFYQLINDTPGRVGPPCQRPASDNPRDLVIDLIEDDSRPSLNWPFWSHTKMWWDARDQPNLLLVHFNDLKKDLPGEMRRIAEFLEVPVESMDDATWEAAVEHCTFAWMKEHAELTSPPQADIAFDGGAKNFINKGTNRRWADVLSEEDNRRYLAKAREELGEEGAAWLEKGRLG
ncbi:P-loop containing nucleoside triphosphate hydrolase protein [Microdochium bolleyi]|uniref:p-loop containing nucleoside triphosphate hydrolase protein n=1 Tax=Microdochium bolleyi TaxID=196109 RepID=A0A136JG87_9PEZI|nr:P-loop containing nucleoside triphosphate hydrolase protein [Microdochium bolleyi]